MRELTKCLVCSSTKFKTYAAGTFSGQAKDAAPYFLANRVGVVRGKIVDCCACGFRFTSPQFRAEEYDEIYKSAPGPASSEIKLDKANARRFDRLANLVRSDVGSGRFLDFGCGQGGFLLAMNNIAGCGFEVGEPSTFKVGPSTVTTGKFFDVLGSEPLTHATFDFITAFDVFEHLPDLDEYVDALAQLLNRRGRLVVTVPDVGSWAAKLSGRRWNMYLLEHLWFFNEDTLKKFIEPRGFRQIRHRKVPYDGSLAHIVRRAAQTYSPALSSYGSGLPDLIWPMPIGVLYSVFERSVFPA